MISLKDHNHMMRQRYRVEMEAKPNSKELFDTNPMLTLTSCPPQKNVHCVCGYEGYRVA